ncbi:MAG: hypothetical protein ACXVII_43365, partial [Solirubrobacteraceae bacterium]
ILFVRGIGVGCTMMPAMAAAYATLSRSAVPRATTALNVLQRVGGSIGTALLAVVLENQIKAAVPHAAGISGGSLTAIPPELRARLADPLAHAFTHTFWWAVAMTAVALVPAALLAFRVRGPGARGRCFRHATGRVRSRSVLSHRDRLRYILAALILIGEAPVLLVLAVATGVTGAILAFARAAKLAAGWLARTLPSHRVSGHERRDDARALGPARCGRGDTRGEGTVEDRPAGQHTA